MIGRQPHSTGITSDEIAEKAISGTIKENTNHTMTGLMDDKWPVTFRLIVDADGNTEGSYCYDRTIAKYGDKPENYFYLKGEMKNGQTFELSSYKYGEDTVFENIRLVPEGEGYRGTLRNINTGKIHFLHLE